MKIKRSLFVVLFMIMGISFYFVPFRKTSSVKIPVIFTARAYCPMIKSEIQGNPYALLVDLGMNNKLCLTKDFFEHIQRIDSGESVTIHDLRGNPYHWKIFSVADVKVGSIDVAKCDIVEETLDFNNNTRLWPSTTHTAQQNSHGSIGWGFFENSCSLFDFPNSSIVVAKSVKELQQDGIFKLENYIATPFTIENGVIVISIETDLGKQKVILDTGSAFCTLKLAKINPSAIQPLPFGRSYFPSGKLLIEGCDFGNWRFAVADMTDLMKADGLLGVDFFLEYAVCFDFVNKMAYFKKPEGCIATQWKRGKYYLTQFFLRAFSDLPKVENL